MEFRTKKQIFGAAIVLSATLFASTVIAKEAVTVEDVNFDSIPDVIVSENGQLTTFLGNGDGTFKKAQKSVSVSTGLPTEQTKPDAPMLVPRGLPADTQAIVAIKSDGSLELRDTNGDRLPECRLCTPALEKKYGDNCKKAPDSARICGTLPAMQVREMINLNILHLKGSDCWFSWPGNNVLNWWPAGCDPTD